MVSVNNLPLFSSAENFIMSELIKNITDKLKSEYNLNISAFHHYFVQTTIKKRMDELGCKGIEAYNQYIGNNPGEILALEKYLRNHHSEFFRNPLTFSVLEQILFSQIFLIQKSHGGRTIRIWSAGCASGQESYTIAIILTELCLKDKWNTKFRIIATDNSEEQILNAKKGIYHKTALSKISIKRADEWFTKKGDYYIVKDCLKANIDFTLFDLIDHPSASPPESIYGSFDIIFCANLIPYYSLECSKIILSKIKQSLNKNGYLITGEVERELVLQSGFCEAYPNTAIFKIIK